MTSNTSTRSIALVHTSPAAIGPLMQFYNEAAPHLQITNLLDDGLLRLLANKNSSLAQERLASMIRTAVEVYGVEIVMITCSSVSQEMVERLGRGTEVPVLKIDYPMAKQAVRAGRRIGVAATFPPTIEPTSRLLSSAAAELDKPIEIISEVSAEAYKALLTADYATHDQLLLEVLKQLQNHDVDVIVLAQVSMARILPFIEGKLDVPVLSSLHTSLEAIQSTLSRPSEAMWSNL